MTQNIGHTLQRLQRSQQLKELVRQTGAHGVWFRTVRRVQGVVHYAHSACFGTAPQLPLLAAKEGTAVAPDYSAATIEEVLPWNQWVTRQHGAHWHARRLLVSAAGQLIGILDLLPRPSQGVDVLIERAAQWDLPSVFLSPPAQTPSRECVLWFSSGSQMRACPSGHQLWRQHDARAAVTSLIAQPGPVARVFYGSLWLERIRTHTGSIVWALPSTAVTPSPLGSLPEAARRVALELMRGTSVPEAAANLRRSKETVRTHNQQIRRRLSLSSRLEMAERLNTVHWR